MADYGIKQKINSFTA